MTCYLELRRNGFDLVRSKAELEAIPGLAPPETIRRFRECATWPSPTARSAQGSTEPLGHGAAGVELLQYQPRRLSACCRCGLDAKSGRKQRRERTLPETVELDRAVATARRYAGAQGNGPGLRRFANWRVQPEWRAFRKDSSIAMLGLNSGGQPWLTWATGPNGIRTYGGPPGSANAQTATPTETSTQYLEPAAVFDKTALPTVTDVLALGIGPGTENLQGVLDNTAVFKIVRDQL